MSGWFFRKKTLNWRVGIGHDTHRLESGSGIRLGGIDIPCEFHLIGHSDADVLLHAIADALLGAAGLDDIGTFFPDTDEINRNRDSSEILVQIVQMIHQQGKNVVNLDCIIFAERPKLFAHKRKIQERIAEILNVSPDCVGVKAKTGEKVGPIGRLEAISAEAVVLLC